jgi:predicted O-methyltransferase YrrM
MCDTTWTEVDHYLTDTLVKPDPILDATLADSVAAGLPAINVSACQGKLLHLLTRIHRAQKILEIGTLGGYSTIWLARALPEGGRIVTLELEEKHAAVARSNFARAGLAGKIDLRVGPAIDALPTLLADGSAPFDLFFIDADKPSNPDYFRWAMKLARPGSVIIIDNVVRKGGVINADSNDAAIRGVRRLNELIAAEPRVTATAVQTVGSKGYDGFAIALVTS